MAQRRGMKFHFDWSILWKLIFSVGTNPLSDIHEISNFYAPEASTNVSNLVSLKIYSRLDLDGVEHF